MKTMRKDQKMHGAALVAAAAKQARKTGYAVVYAKNGRAVRVAPDGTTREGWQGEYEFCLNFGPGSL